MERDESEKGEREMINIGNKLGNEMEREKGYD